MRLPRRQRLEIPLRHETEAHPVPIVADASIATAVVGEGRNIPLLILDTSSRPDIETMVQAHQTLGPGDATSVWSFKESGFVCRTPRLLLKVTKPSECVVVIDFDMAKRQGPLVDQIVWAQGVYLQPGRPGDRLATTMDNPKILVEVPASKEFEKRFWPIYEKAIFRNFRQMGMSRADAKQSVQTFLREWRDIFHRRIQFRRGSEKKTRSGATSP